MLRGSILTGRPGGEANGRRESGLDRLDSVCVRVGNLVKDRRPPEAAALRAVLDKIANTNNRHPCDQGRNPIGFKFLFWRGWPCPARPGKASPAGLWRPDVLKTSRFCRVGCHGAACPAKV